MKIGQQKSSSLSAESKVNAALLTALKAFTSDYDITKLPGRRLTKKEDPEPQTPERVSTHDHNYHIESSHNGATGTSLDHSYHMPDDSVHLENPRQVSKTVEELNYHILKLEKEITTLKLENIRMTINDIIDDTDKVSFILSEIIHLFWSGYIAFLRRLTKKEDPEPQTPERVSTHDHNYHIESSHNGATVEELNYHILKLEKEITTLKLENIRMTINDIIDDTDKSYIMWNIVIRTYEINF
ncbi:hypothetical protein KUTeg_000256 [Tegillarca granosa]|uniref:Uncharacterized protein n=1 Tax=Tegillarca granosa TaxID=220873 RepID=A0ABQ9FX20_TEGGR|nr:hypothetical protein KUTeg_000256 [Tegillarca granosa]